MWIASHKVHLLPIQLNFDSVWPGDPGIDHFFGIDVLNHDRLSQPAILLGFSDRAHIQSATVHQHGYSLSRVYENRIGICRDACIHLRDGADLIRRGRYDG